jgi:hypothetical protein
VSCSCQTCREYAAFYRNRVLFLVIREDDEVHVGVDELTEQELARFAAEGTDTEKGEITDWLSEPGPTPEEMERARLACNAMRADAA